MTSLFDYCKQNNKEYILQEWDYELNKYFNIKTILTGSNKKVWWKCTKCNGVSLLGIPKEQMKSGRPYYSEREIINN